MHTSLNILTLPKAFSYLGFGGQFKRIAGDLYGHSQFVGAAFIGGQWILGEYIGWDSNIEYAAQENSDVVKCQDMPDFPNIDYDPAIHENVRINIIGPRYPSKN